MHTEIELKLLIDPADIPLLQQHPVLKNAHQPEPDRQKLHSIYFDTPECDLARLKMALRLRLVGKQWIQTVKGGGKVEGGLHQRQEWEVPVVGGAPDFEKLAESPWSGVFTPSLQSRLAPIFVTDFWRTTWLLEGAEGVVELALDTGEVQASLARVAICEVELELKSGKPAALFDLASMLQTSIALKPEDQSKADRGYMLYRNRANLENL